MKRPPLGNRDGLLFLRTTPANNYRIREVKLTLPELFGAV